MSRPGAAFAIATGILFAILTMLWLLAARGDRPEYRRASRLFVTGTAACAVLLGGTAFLPAGARVLAWGLIDVAYLAGFVAVLLTANPAVAGAAATVSLVDNAHDSRTPVATAWLLCAGTAVVLCSMMLVTASLRAWDRDPGLYRPLARLFAVVAAGCLVLGAIRPTPLLLALALDLLLSIPWGFAVAHRASSESPAGADS